MTKKCSRCEIDQPLDSYYSGKGQCKTCYSEIGQRYRESNAEKVREKNSRYRANNREKVNARNRRYRQETDYSRTKRLKEYSLTQDEYDSMVLAQGGLCAVCGKDSPGRGTSWAIDHDHRCCPGSQRCCGKCIRGLLCHSCNQAIGLLGDDPDRMLSAAAYVLKNSDLLRDAFSEE